MKYWFDLNASDVIAICALFIALCSLFVTFLQVCLSRAHNILSVKPQLYISSHFVIGDNIVFSMGNSGVGTALIKGVYVKTQELPELIELSSYSDYELMLNSIGIDIKSKLHKVRTFNSDIPIGVGQEVNFIEFIYSDDHKFIFKEMIKVLASLEITVHYECIYQRKFTAQLTAAKLP
ncbi:hypothetical protein [Vibrio metoecus]|uniref:hypothetical protein n=1 Tax=Vibrio metoecus TaxID=1481663 RepID=UPI001140DC29|nr:hypothetical protein [Vibrio metoecus]